MVIVSFAGGQSASGRLKNEAIDRLTRWHRWQTLHLREQAVPAAIRVRSNRLLLGRGRGCFLGHRQEVLHHPDFDGRRGR
jgi:hypothetical protein